MSVKARLNVKESNGLVIVSREDEPPVFISILKEDWLIAWRAAASTALEDAYMDAYGRRVRATSGLEAAPLEAFEMDVEEVTLQ